MNRFLIFSQKAHSDNTLLPLYVSLINSRDCGVLLVTDVTEKTEQGSLFVLTHYPSVNVTYLGKKNTHLAMQKIKKNNKLTISSLIRLSAPMLQIFYFVRDK